MAKKSGLLRSLFKSPLRVMIVVLVAAAIVGQVSMVAGHALVILDCMFAGLMLICGWRPFKKKRS